MCVLTYRRTLSPPVVSENIVSANLRLPAVAKRVGADWPLLAHELNLSNKDVETIQSRQETDENRCLSMLQLWVKQAGVLATGKSWLWCLLMGQDWTRSSEVVLFV